MTKTFTLLLLTLSSLTASACAYTESKATNVCGFSFDLEGGSFNPLSKDESSCSAFAAIDESSDPPHTASIIAIDQPPKVALSNIPGNFYLDAESSIAHHNPEPVSDDKNFYYVNDIQSLGGKDYDLGNDSHLKVFSYQRTITRINLRGEEASEPQVCVDAVRYDDRTTALFAGCVEQTNGQSLHDRAVRLMKSARVLDRNP